MATILHFNGHKGLKEGHRLPTPPLSVPIAVDENGDVIGRGWAPGDEIVFDKAFAERYGRVCECHDDGTCFAEQHAAAWTFEYDQPATFEVTQVSDRVAKKAKAEEVTETKESE